MIRLQPAGFALLPLMLLAGLLGCAATTDSALRDWDQVPWSEHRYTNDELQDNRELRSIQRRIDDGSLPRVQFDFDKATIRPESYPTLNVLADWLLRHPARKVHILAYTCNIGTAGYNQELSSRRAKSVLEYLVRQGVEASSLHYTGMGMAHPLFPNDTEEHREKNRRVEFRLVTDDWDSVL